MDTTTFFNKSQCSIEFEENSKGPKWVIKAYGDTLDECITQIKDANAKMKLAYPRV